METADILDCIMLYRMKLSWSRLVIVGLLGLSGDHPSLRQARGVERNGNGEWKVGVVRHSSFKKHVPSSFCSVCISSVPCRF